MENFSHEELAAFYSQIGRNVKKFRELNKLTQLELSLLMGYKSVSLISAAELHNDKKHFNLEHLYKISKILNIPLEDLIKLPRS